MRRNSEKKKSGGGLWGPAISVTILGLIGGFFWLVTLVPVVGEADGKAPPALRLTYNTGEARSDGQWRLTLRRMMLEGPGGSARFTSGDVNAIAREVVDFDGGARREDQAGPRLQFSPAGFNVRWGEEKSQISVVLRAVRQGKNYDLHLLVRGNWAGREGQPKFVVRESFVNSARLPAPVGGVLFRHILGKLAEAGEEAEAVRAWQKVKEITSGDGWVEVIW